ncbi:WASH complex subunit 3 [Atheta coriaria]|uniref:WASH complex subunit 3 n=1 Tax=Dalotia coriaria TaxID=877792 RepID=UPI0031F3DA43
MEVDDIPQIAPNVDFNSIQPIHQKRTIAFVNHFLLSTVSFLNDFASSCESRLMQFEYKLQKVEASLLILESQLSSIPDLNDVSSKPAQVNVDLPEVEVTTTDAVVVETEQNQSENVNAEQGNEQKDEKDVNTEENNNGLQSDGLKASADPRFRKVFKMLQFGVPAEAVRLKMKAEGVDPQILDNPNAVIEE